MITPLGWLDTWSLAASLIRKERREELKKANGRLVVREGKWQHPGTVKDGPWAAMRQAIQKANRAILERQADLEIAEVVVEELSPGDSFPWTRGNEGEVSCSVFVVTNPKVVILVGQARPQIPCVHIPTGDVVVWDSGLWHSKINGGETTSISLNMRLTKRIVEI